TTLFRSIEAAMAAHADVEFASAAATTAPSGDTVLVGYVLPKAGRTVDTAGLREHVRGFLPGYMVPSLITVIDEVPLTPVGKLDRRALPEPEFFASADEQRLPQTELERIVAERLAEVLGADSVGADESFFELGGNSLVATKLMARINEALGTDAPVRVLFESPSAAELARRLGEWGVGADAR